MASAGAKIKPNLFTSPKYGYLIMKKSFLLIICVLVFGAACFGLAASLSNKDSAGLYVNSIEQVLRLDADEVDLATAVLIISEQWNDNVYGHRYIARLDEMAIEIRQRLSKKRIPMNRKAIPVINKYLFDELGFRAVAEATNPDDLFLHSVLDKKRGYCLSLSVLYLAIGERLGLPLYGVVAPGHFFVRYDDGQKVRFNIEATSNGGYAKDDYYIKEYNCPDGDDSVYMINLDKMQTLGCFFNNLGNSYLNVGNIEQAKIAIERAIEINPTLSEARSNMGNIYMRLGRTEDAIYEYKTALWSNQNDAKIHCNLGSAYSAVGRVAEAIIEYRLSIDIDPDFADAYANLGVAYCQQQRFPEAVMWIKRAISMEPKNGDFYNQLGSAYCQQGDYRRGVSQYKISLKLKPGLAEAYCGLAVCYGYIGEDKKEVENYQKAIELEPEMVVALTGLGCVYFEKEEYDEAIELYLEVVRLLPGDVIAYRNLGAAYFNQADYGKAVQWYSRTIAIDPDIGEVHRNLAFSYYYLKDYESSLRHARIAKELGVEVQDGMIAELESKLEIK